MSLNNIVSVHVNQFNAKTKVVIFNKLVLANLNKL